MNAKTNAKEEFLDHIEGKPQVIAAILVFEIICKDYNIIKFPLKATQEDYDKFLNSIDIDYDSGFGGQELYGTIWYADGTWSEREDYDGSEWWEYKKCPKIDLDNYSTFNQ